MEPCEVLPGDDSPDCQTAAWPSVRRRGRYAGAHESIEGLYLADRTLFGWFGQLMRSRGSPVAQAPVGAPSGLRRRGRSPSGGYCIRYWAGTALVSRQRGAPRRAQQPIDGQPTAARLNSRSATCLAVSWMKGILNDAVVNTAGPRSLNGAKNSTRYLGSNSYLNKLEAPLAAFFG
jgi:hypothetical protein